MRTDHFGKDGGKRASECGPTTNTRFDARFPPGFVERLQSNCRDYSDESFWGAVKRPKTRKRGSSLSARHVEPLEARLALDSTVVLNEIMYNPAGPGESLEFIELYNQMAVDMDISAWRLADGVQYLFPEGTTVPGGGFLVVAKDPSELAAASGHEAALGPYSGQLANDGETIELRDRNDRLMDSIQFADERPWPVAPDGSGTSLAKIDPLTTSGDARHWSSSVLVGGTPGLQNFPEADADKSFVSLVPLDHTWRYQASDTFPGASWPAVDFADDNWSSGHAPFFAGDARLDGPAVELVSDVTATASSELAGFDRVAAYLVDGSGLAGDAHGITPDGSMWLNQGTFGGGRPDREPEITFDLGSVRNVSQMKVWNYNEDLPNRPELLGRGVSSADVLVAGEDGVFSVLIADQQFGKAPGTQSDFSQTIDLNGVAARFVKLDIHGNFPGGDNDFVGLSEVQFFAAPDPFQTELPRGANTYYYRAEFQFDGDPRSADLLLSNIVDDGAVFYLNGVEVYRQNLPAQEIEHATLASSAIGSAAVSEVIQLSVESLVRGRNVLAVEVHQATADDSDMAFAAELNALAVLPRPGDVSTLVALNDTWRFEATGTDLGTEWRDADFDDDRWEGGRGTSLVGFWPLDGNAEAVVGTDGSLVNNPRRSVDRKGVPDGSIRFRDNRQHRIDIPGGGGLDGADTGTISMWVRWLGEQDADCCGGTAGSVFSRQANGQFSDNIITLDNTDPSVAHVVWRQSGGPAPPLITSTTVVGDGAWRHVAVTFSPEGSELFVDGLSQGTAIGNGLNSNPEIPLVIGAWAGDGNGYSSSEIDDVAIWNGVLAAEQIAALAEHDATPLHFAGSDSAIYFAGDAQLASPTVGLVRGITATASSELQVVDDRWPAASAADGSGLVGDSHVAQPPVGTMWVSNGNLGVPSDVDPEITFDLGRELAVESMRVWNYNESNAGGLKRGIAKADILVAGQDQVFTTHIAGQTFAQASGTNSDFSEIIDLGGVQARFIKIDVDTSQGVANHGDPFGMAGLSEVQFTAQLPPGPSELPLGPTTHYFRKQFEFDKDPERTDLLLNTVADDGVVAYLNGTEIFRQNVPGGEVSFDTLAVSEVIDAAPTGNIQVPSGSLVRGVNVLAVEVHQSQAGDRDMIFGAELTAITSPPMAEPIVAAALAINEMAAASEEAYWFELLNHGDEPIDLNGYVVASSTGAEHTLAAPTLDAKAHHVVTEEELGFEIAPGDRIHVYNPDRTLVVNSAMVTNSLQGRWPDGTGEFLFPQVATPGTANQFDFRDEIVINEIMYHAPASPSQQAIPPVLDDRTIVPFDASWRYSKPFTFGVGDVPYDAGPDWADQSHAVDRLVWFEGAGPVGFASGRLPERIATQLSNPQLNTSPITTYYFETEFGLTQEQIDQMDELILRHTIDDGAVFYINGVEVDRFNLPDGTITVSTFATDPVGRAALHESSLTFRDVLVATPETNRLSIEVHQSDDSENDVVMGAELISRRIVATAVPAVPYQESDEEWVELYNRGDQPVDLGGWRLDDAVRFGIPEGTKIGAGEYLVVARDRAALAAKYPEIGEQIVGDFAGSLSNRTERVVLLDAVGNPADAVEYFENGSWPETPDGGGSSLELRNPHADNSRGAAWAGSIEWDDSPWQTITHQGVAGRSTIGPDGEWHEFLFGMLAAGDVLLDDVSVVEDPDGAAIELIQNGSFEADTIGEHAATWRLIGNHRHSEVILDPDDPGNQVLRLVSTGDTEHMHNHAETTLKNGDDFVRIGNDTEYRTSFRAKWMSGSNQLHSRLYFNRLAHANLLQRPTSHGTPGRQNSTFEPNIGPTYAGFQHLPAVPDANEPVTVTVAAQDPDGVADVTLWYSVEGGPWESTPMTAAGGDLHTAQIPGQAEGLRVQFYVQGEDVTGVASTFPRGGANSRALFQVDNGLAETNGLHNLRMILTPSDADLLHDTVELMSNDLIGATVIYNEEQVFYDAGIRLSGSQRARPFQPRLSFSIGFDTEHLFRGVHGAIILDRSESTGFGQREFIYHHGMNHSGGLPTEYNDLMHIITPRLEHTGSAEAQLARVSDVFLDSQFENGSAGQVFEYELTYFPQTTDDGTPEGRKRPQPDGTRGVAITDLGDDKENYRWAFLIKSNRVADDYSRLIEFAKAMGQRGDVFNQTIGDFIDVEQWLRAFAFSVITGHGDNYGVDGSQHNLQVYIRPSDQRVLQFPHDADAFFQFNRAIVAAGDLRKLIDLPGREHMYYGHVHDMIQTTFNEDYMSRWTEHFGSFLPQQRFDQHLSDLVRRSVFLLEQINSRAPEVDFAITTSDVSTDSSQATIEGTGWINVRELRAAGSGVPLDVTWNTVTSWQATVPLGLGENNITIEAYDFQGQLIGSENIVITSTVNNRVADSLRITELNYNPYAPTEAELAVNPQLDNDDFEFVELKNIGAVPLNLLGVHFTAGIDYAFPPVVLGSGESALLVRDLDAFRLRYGSEINVVDQFTAGQLSNAGERIALADALGQTVVNFEYGDDAPWPERADGNGATLVLSDPANSTTAQYEKYYHWRGSTELGGSPGRDAAEPVAVLINEVFSNTDAPLVDSIELYNATDTPVDISGWFLSDSADNLLKFEIPAGTVLGPRGYVTFDESHFNSNPDNPSANNFALSGSRGDDVWLVISNGDGGVASFVDDVHFGAARNGESFGRAPDGDGLLAPLLRTTLGQPNAAPRIGPLVISELHYNPAVPSESALAIDPDLDRNDLEFVEILNPTSSAGDLQRWQVTGGVDYEFNSPAPVDSSGTIVLVSFDPADADNVNRVAAFRAQHGIGEGIRLVGPFQGQLADGGEKIQLRRPDEPSPDDPALIPRVLEDEVIYDDLLPWPTAADGTGPSLHRISPTTWGNAADSWTAANPTPGTADLKLRIPGDSNEDGVFDQADLDLVIQAGKYLTGLPATFSEGDWNQDGVFNQLDIVFALHSQ